MGLLVWQPAPPSSPEPRPPCPAAYSVARPRGMRSRTSAVRAAAGEQQAAAGRGGRPDRAAPEPGEAEHAGRAHRRGVLGRQGQDPRHRGVAQCDNLEFRRGEAVGGACLSQPLGRFGPRLSHEGGGSMPRGPGGAPRLTVSRAGIAPAPPRPSARRVACRIRRRARRRRAVLRRRAPPWPAWRCSVRRRRSAPSGG